MTAGQLTKRVTLLEPVEALDADAKVVQSHQNRGTVWCHVRWLRGGEAVMQARLTAKSPAIVTVRAFSLTRQIDSDWQLRIDGRDYELREDPRESEDRAFLEMLIERVG